MFNWLQNLLGNIDPFGVKAQVQANTNLAAQQNLRAQQEVQKQQEIQTRQQRPGGLPTPQYQQIQGTAPITNQQNYAPSSPTSQAGGAEPPPYAPDTVNQTVFYNGGTWKGNPGTGWSLVGMEQPGGGGVDELVNAIVDPVSKALDTWRNKLEEFDKNNPFAFDEAQARASSQERLNPYYDATLNEFMTGIRRSSARSVEDQTRTIGELNVDASRLSEQERLSTQEAIRSSEEGFAGAGLFFSGKRARASGMEEVQGARALEDIETKKLRGIGDVTRMNTRTQEDLALQEARTKRLTAAERTTALETDIAKQKREAEIRRAQEKLAFAGPAPGSGSSFDTQNQLFGLY